MKLKYYLRGIGIGVILTAAIMGFALGGRKTIMSDAQVIQRAKELGMTEGGVLSEANGESGNNDAAYASLSVEALDEAGKEKTKEIIETVTTPSESASKVDEKAKETEAEKDKTKTDTSKTTQTSSKEKTESATTAATVTGKEENKKTEEVKTSENSDTKTEQATATTEAASDSVDTQETANIKEQEKDESQSETATNTQETVETSTENVEQPSGGGYVTTSSKTIVIPGGLGSDAVARLLYNEGIIDNAVAFDSYLTTNRMDRYIRSGTKVIPSGASYADIAAILIKG